MLLAAEPMPAVGHSLPAFTWSGLYVGVHAGATLRSEEPGPFHFDDPTGSVGAGTIDAINADLAHTGGHRTERSGFSGGAQIGHNWQFGGLVVGIEADINTISRGGRNDSYTILNIAGSGDDLTVYGGRRGSNWFGTIRPRVGFAMDRTLLYVTGGLAYSGGGNRGGGGFAELRDGGTGALVAGWYETRRRSSNWGWTLGGGVEHAFTTKWTAKMEYLYADVAEVRGGNYVSAGNGFPYDNLLVRRRRNDNGSHVIRLGLNLHFGGGSAGSAFRY